MGSAARTPRQRTATGLLLALVVSLGSCRSPGAPAPDRASACDRETYALLEAHRERYRDAVRRARSWLDALHVDPLQLRELGIKGKKKLAEQLDAYYRLWQIAAPEERAGLRRRIEEVVAVTYEPRYHDMAAVGDRQFKQDATSYLRIAVVMDRLGLDTALYREEIRRIHARLNAQMTQRGPHQRAAFHWYYRHFGLAEPFPLGAALEEGYIARRFDPDELGSAEAYQITHEIFVPYEYGDRLDADPFDDEDVAYLRTTLDVLTERFLARGNADLAAELVSSLRYLRFVDSPMYRRGLVFLLERQNADGSWGPVEWSRRRFGPWGLHLVILHTTKVSLDALTLAFHEPWNRGLFAGCGP